MIETCYVLRLGDDARHSEVRRSSAAVTVDSLLTMVAQGSAARILNTARIRHHSENFERFFGTKLKQVRKIRKKNDQNT